MFDDVYSAALADQAFATVVNYSSGAGRLSAISWYHEDLWHETSVGINIDGAGEVLAAPGDAKSGEGWQSGEAQKYGGAAPFNLEFTSSLVVRVKNNDGAAAKNTGGAAWYGILSHEVERLIIPAGDPLPDRNYTEPMDVLCIMIDSGSDNLASRLVYPINQKIDTEKEEVQDSEFLTTINGPTRQFVKNAFTGIEKLIIDGVYYDLTVNNGVIELTSIPNLITREAFLDRFTSAEQAEIIFQSREHATAAVRKGLQDLMFQIQTRNKINLRWGQLITKVNQLESFGLIGAGRADEILT